MTVKNVVRILIGLLFVIFVIQNAEVVEVRFLFWGAEASRALVLCCVFALGLIAGWLPIRITKKKEGAGKDKIKE